MAAEGKGKAIRRSLATVGATLVSVVALSTAIKTPSSSLDRLALLVFSSGISIGIGHGVWASTDPELVLLDSPPRNLWERLRLDYVRRIWAFVRFFFLWGYGSIAIVLALGLVTLGAASLGPTLAKFLFVDLSPTAAAAIIAAVALLVTTIINVLVGRPLDARRESWNAARTEMRPLYARVHAFVLEFDLIPEERETEWRCLADDVLLGASSRVVDAFGDYSKLARARIEDRKAEAARDRRLCRQRLIRLMRRDLGLATSTQTLPANWSDFELSSRQNVHRHVAVQAPSEANEKRELGLR